jgi:uncharacterized protein YbjT (DUF2867 family)
MSDSKPVLIVGASGKVGGELLRLLEANDVKVRAATRSPEQRHARQDTTEWVTFDLERPETYGPALSGIRSVFLIARPGDDHPETTALPLIASMRQAGVEHVVDLTAMGCEVRPDFGLRKVELALEGSGLAFTHLRPNFFMQIFTSGLHRAQIMMRRQIRLPAADACISFIDVQDIAEVAARCLLAAEHRSQAYTLTGGVAISHTMVAKAIADATQTAVQYVALTEDEARADLAAAGLPSANVERLIEFYRLVRTGAAATVSPSVEKILGRPPRTFTDFAAQRASDWTR